MNAVVVGRELVSMATAPLVCRLRGHRWHVWSIHAATPLRICRRCSRTG